MPDFIPSEDSKLISWLASFSSGCANNSSILGLLPAELVTISNASTDFTDQMLISEEAKNAAKAATDSKNVQRRTSVDVARRYAKEFKANPAVPQNILISLGIVTNNTSGPVVPATNLLAEACSDGINKLAWSNGGNAPGTIYLVETKEDGQAQWEFLAAITATKFNHTDQIPGEPVWYRVIATRSGVSAAPSNTAVVYGGGGTNQLTVAA